MIGFAVTDFCFSAAFWRRATIFNFLALNEKYYSHGVSANFNGFLGSENVYLDTKINGVACLVLF